MGVLGRRPTTVRPRWYLELVLLVGAYELFTRLQNMLGHDPSAAMAHARQVQRMEDRLHLAWELAGNGWADRHEVLAKVAAEFYAVVLVAPPAVLVVLFLARPDVYRRLRSQLLLLTFVALVPFWAYPVAPPRFAIDGIVDLVATRSVIAGSMSPGTDSRQNLYASLPSLHVAWSLWCGLALCAALPARRRGLCWLPLLFPLAVAFDVVLTGNHYVIDVLAGAALALASAGAVAVGYRPRGQDQAHGPAVAGRDNAS